MKPNLFNRLFRRRESIANDARLAEREAAIANALDPSDAIDFSEGADGWFKISPYGQFKGKVPGRPQIFQAENAIAMESEFNSLLGRLGRKFRGVPIYHGHPDVDPEIWTDDRRIGKITQLEARPDGLWGYAEWNSLGDENKKEGWWIYPSPRWDQPAGKATFAPDRLISVGLTNTPRITHEDGNEPVHNSPHPTETTDTMDRTKLTQELGLPPEATDEEIFAKITAIQAAATDAETRKTELENTKTDLTAANLKKDEMANSLTAKEQECNRLREAHNNSLLDAAEKDTRITPADRGAWKTKLEGTNREQEINSLTALQPKLNTKRLDLSDRREERKEGDELREQVANAIGKLKKVEGLSHDAAWKKVKRDPAFKAYFERTEG